MSAKKKFNALPGFRRTMGYTLLYLSLIVLIPLAALFLRVFDVATSRVEITAKDVEEDAATWLSEWQRHETPLTIFLWDKLSAPTQTKITAWKEIATADEKDPAAVQVQKAAEAEQGKLVTEMLREVNAVVHGPSLYDTNRFSDFSELSPKTKWLLKHSGHTAWLNRSLLEDGFQGILQKRTNWLDLWLLATSARAMAAYKLTFGASFIAALINAVFGTLLAWVLVRYDFPGKRFFDALVDFPFALPTAVAGLTLANLFAKNGWFGKYLVPMGIEGTSTALGVVIALTFVGLPFVVRTLQPVLEDFEREVEEAAATLGASRLRTFCSVIAPALFPAILTGFALSFARALGEYGSVIFIAGNKPFSSEIAPLLIIIQLEEFNYAGAMALAVVLLLISFCMLITINLIERWASRYQH